MSTEGKVTTDNVVVSKVDALKTVNGKNAFEMAVLHGYTGTFEDWIESITSGRLTDGHKEAIAALFFEKYGLELAVEKKARIDADNFILEALGFDEVSKTAYEDYCLSAINRMNEALGFVPPQLAEIENNPENGKRVWIDENEDGTYTLNTMKNSVVDVTDPYNIWPVTYTYDLTAYRGFKLFCRSNKDWFNPAGLSYGYALYNESGDKILLGGNVTTVDIPSTEGHSYYSAYDFVLDVPSNAGVLIISSTNRAEEIEFTLEPIINIYKKVTALDIMVPAVDDAVIEGSTNPVSSDAVYEYGSGIETALGVNIKAAAQGARDYARMYVDDKIGDIDFSEVQEQIDNLGFVNFENLPYTYGWLQSKGIWSEDNKYKFKLISVKPDEVVYIKTGDKSVALACLIDDSGINGIGEGSSVSGSANLSSIGLFAHSTQTYNASRFYQNAGTEESYTIPTDAKYLWLCFLENDIPIEVKSIAINGYDILSSPKDNLDKKADSTELAKIKDDVQTYANEQIEGLGFFNINDLPKRVGYINTKNTWAIGDGYENYEFVLIPVKPDEVIRIKANYNASSYLACLTDFAGVSNGILASLSTEGIEDVSTGEINLNRITLASKTEKSYKMPSDAKYLWLCTKEKGINKIPDVLTINGYDILRSARENIADKLDADDLAEVKAEACSYADDLINDLDLIDINKLPRTVGYLNGSGMWATSDSFSNYEFVLIPVKSGEVVKVKANASASTYLACLTDFTDETYVNNTAAKISTNGMVTSKGVVVTTRVTLNKGIEETYTMPSDAKYLWLCTLETGIDKVPDTLTINSYDILNSARDNIGSVLGGVTEIKDSVDKFADFINPNVRWCAMGDSITEGFVSYTENGEGKYKLDIPNSWVYKLSKRKNWDVTNEGIGGTGFISRGPDNGTKDSAWMVAEKVANEIEGGKGFEKFDIVTIAYGVNDWKQRKTLGEFNDAFETPTTAYGGMRKTIETIIASNPYCKIYMITPINCISCGGTEATNWGIDKTNDDANYPDLKVYSLGDMFEAIKEVCEYYGIEMIDMTHSSIVNRKNIEVCLEDDIHPNVATHAAMARELGAKINYI